MKLFNSTITKNTANKGISGGYYQASTSTSLEMDYQTDINDNTPEFICNLGEYRNANLKCTSCTPGKYQDQYNFGGCKHCEMGKATDKNSAAICKECEISEYQDEKGQTDCKRYST